MDPLRRASTFLQSIRFFRFGVIGVLSTTIYAVVVFLCINFLAATPSIASVVGYVVAIPFNFLGQRRYTFRSAANPSFEAVLFVAVQVVNICIAAAVMGATTANGHSYLLGIVLVVAVIPVINYLMLRIVVFRFGVNAQEPGPAGSFILKSPSLYEAFQIGFGFSGARKLAISKYLDVRPGQKILDIGCGPGQVLAYLPEGVDYTGFDVDPGYIEHATRVHGDRGKFYCRPFDDSVLDEFHDADLVMYNGVLHHLDDDLARAMLSTSYKALRAGGKVFTLDGCYRPGQGIIRKTLLDMDRGQFVRTQPQYEALIRTAFADVKANLDEKLSPLPYSFMIMVATK